MRFLHPDRGFGVLEVLRAGVDELVNWYRKVTLIIHSPSPFLWIQAPKLPDQDLNPER